MRFNIVLACLTGAVVAARVSTLMLEAQLLLGPVEVRALGAPRAPTSSERALDLGQMARLLALSERPKSVAPAMATSLEDVPFRLAGTLSPARAMLVRISDGRVRTAEVGDQFEGATVVEVGHAWALVTWNGQLVQLTTRPATAQPRAAVQPAGGPGRLNRQELSKSLEHLDSMSQQLRLVPAFIDGVASGFRIAWLQPDSLLQRLGVLQGDVIRRINGLDLSRAENLAQLYAQAQTTRRIDVDLNRGGAPVTVSVQVE